MDQSADRRSRPMRFLTLVVVFTTLTGGSCVPDTEKLFAPGLNAVQDASEQIDVTVQKLQQTSASWQDELNNLESRLTGDAKKLINNDIQNLITRTVNHAGVEFRCNADFINQRVAESLLGIKAKIMGKPIPALQPQFCSAIPEAVDMKLVPNDVKLVTFYGYNFDNNAGYRLMLENTNGTSQDVTRAISIPTAYAMTLALGPSGATLSSNSSKLDLYWKDKLVSTVSIIQPTPEVKVCQSSVVATVPQRVGPYFPPLVAGDDEFGGHGPTIWVSGNLTSTPVDVTLHMRVRERETKSDWTEVSGTADYPIYRAPAGHRIDKILGPTAMTFGPITEGDEHWEKERGFKLGEGGLLSEISLLGDHDGKDVGRAGLTNASVNPIQIVLSESGNCVPPTALNSLIGTRFISQDLTRAVSSRLGEERNRINHLAGRVVLH